MTNTRPPLRRSRRNRVIAGVCGGLAEFFGISAFWFRLAFLIALIARRRARYRRLYPFLVDRPEGRRIT